MAFSFDELKFARDRGYSDDEIWNIISSENKEIGLAKERGYSLEEVASIESGKPMPSVEAPEPEPREFFSFEDAVSAIGAIPEALAVGIPSAYQKLVTGLEIPEKSKAIESELAFQERIQTEQADRVASGKATSVGSAIREALPSLGFSVLPMAAAIPAGIGGGMVGGPAGVVTGPAAAMAASGTVAYRMAGSDMMYRAYKQLEEAKGSPLTNEEKAEYYKTILPIAQNYGLWEAGPEAVSNAITMGAGKFVFGFGKQAAKQIVGESIAAANKTLARKIAEKGAAAAGGLGVEIASEGVTSVGQYPEEAKVRQLAATGEISSGEPPSYPGGYIQAVKDVAPATIALYGMMGTAAGGAKLTTLPFRSQKTPEQIAEDNINLEADRVSNELSIGETDEKTKSINAALETARNNLIAKKEVYTTLEPTDPAAQSLGLEIREMENQVFTLDNELKKRIGQPLSETITDQERKTQELAQQMMSVSTDINNLKDEIANDEMGLQAIEKTAPAYQTAELALNEKKANLAALQTQFDKLSAGPAEKIKPKIQITNIDSIINQGGGTLAVQEDGRDVNFKQFGIVIDGDSAEVAFVEIDPSEYGRGIGLEAYRYLGNELASRGITLRSSGAQYGPGKNLWLKLAQQGNARINGTRRFEFVVNPAAATATPTATKETTIAKIDELNKEFDALDENDQVGIDRVNKSIAVEQNKLAELTAIEQGVEPQGTTPTREMELPPSGRTTTPTRPRMLAGEFYADRPILKAFMSATDKVVGAIPVFSKRAQKLKNAIRTGITSNAGFLAGTNTEVISSEEYGKLTGGKQVAADTGTYRATFFNGKKYLVVPDINQLAGISIEGEQRAASRDAGLDQESRAAAKKLEEEMIHLSMFQGIQDEYKNILIWEWI